MRIQEHVNRMVGTLGVHVACERAWELRTAAMVDSRREDRIFWHKVYERIAMIRERNGK